MQERLENTTFGRLLISVGLIVTLTAILVASLPESGIKTRLSSVAAPYLYATGLDQRWDLFAPNPAETAVHVESRIDYADGTSSFWRFPCRSGLGAYLDYRGCTFAVYLSVEGKNSLWRPFAEYLANQARAEGHQPVRVTLLRYASKSLPPGPGPDREPWHESELFTEVLGGPR